MADEEPKIRGYFWRRFFALLIDSILISAIVTLAGILLYEPTGGRIRLEQTFFSVRTCVAPDTTKINPADLKLPADFRATGAGSCTSTFLGFVHDRRLFLEEVTKPNPATTYTRSMNYPLDQDGRLQIPIFYLDSLTLIFLIGYILLAEWRFGATLGKALLKLRVRSLANSDGKLTLGQAAKRLARFSPYIPFAGAIIFVTVIWFSGGILLDNFRYLIPFYAVAVIMTLAIASNFVIAIRRGQRPWHDRWANTAVILGRDQSIAPTPFNPA